MFKAVQTDANASVPDPTVMLEGTGTPQVVNKYVDPQQASERFRTLRDFRLPVDKNRPSSFEAYIPLYETKTEFESGGTIPINNNIFVLVASNIDVTDTSDIPRFVWETKVVYRD